MAFELAEIVNEATRILLAEPGKGTKIEFIFQMQAQFAANLGRLKATVTRLGANVEQLSAARPPWTIRGIPTRCGWLVIAIEYVMADHQHWPASGLFVSALFTQRADRRGQLTSFRCRTAGPPKGVGKVLTPPPGIDFHGDVTSVATLYHSEVNTPGASVRLTVNSPLFPS